MYILFFFWINIILWQKTFPTVFLRSKIQTYGSFDMKNQYPPIVEKSLKVIEHLTEKFGWFTIRVYQFPLIPWFETFLESMQRNLIRHGLFSWYMWAKFKNKDMVLLVHFGRDFWSGHFESESDKIIPSLWQRQSQLSYLMADWLILFLLLRTPFVFITWPSCWHVTAQYSIQNTVSQQKWGNFGEEMQNTSVKMAEREGFEPPEAFTSSVFKTDALNHSTISPQKI